MSSSCSINNKVSTDASGLLSPFVYQAPSEESTRQKYPSNIMVGSGAICVQYPVSSPTNILSYSTPIRYHLPTRMREALEISCFESDDEDHKERMGVKKALAMATGALTRSGALTRWTRKRANSSSNPRALQHVPKQVQAPGATGTTKSKIQSQNQQVAEHSWALSFDAKSTLHRVQWSGSTLASVAKPYLSSVPICKESKQATTANDFGSDLESERNLDKGDSISKWIGWHGSNPFELDNSQKLRRMGPSGPPPSCPLPPLPTEA